MIHNKNVWCFSLLSIWTESSIFPPTLEAYGRPGNKATWTVGTVCDHNAPGLCRLDILNMWRLCPPPPPPPILEKPYRRLKDNRRWSLCPRTFSLNMKNS